MAYREVTMIEITEVLRQWLAGARRKQIAGGSGSTRRPCAATCGRRRAADLAPGMAGDGAHRRAARGDPHRAACAARSARTARAWQQCVDAAGVHRRRSCGPACGCRRSAGCSPRQGVEMAPATLYRFAIAELGFGRDRGDDPGGRRRAGRGAAARHGLDDAARARCAGTRRRFRAWIFTPGRVALPLRLPVLRRDDRDRDRGVRGGLGVLRRRLPRPHPGQHQGDRHDGRSAGAARRRSAFLEYAQARGFVDRPGARAARQGQGARRARGALRARRLLRRRDARHARAGARARRRVVSRGGRAAPPRPHPAPAARALRGRGAGGAAAGADRAVRRAALGDAEGRPRSARPGRQGALLAADPLRRQDAARPRRSHDRALLRRRRRS